MFQSIDDHHRATNTKSPSKVKYNAGIFTLCDSHEVTIDTKIVYSRYYIINRMQFILYYSINSQ